MIVRMLRTKKLSLFLLFLVAASLWTFGTSSTQVIHASPALPAENNGLAPTPFMGWTTWSYVGKNPTEANVEAQARVEASKLKAYGYNYVLLDDWYYLNPATTVDQYGRWVIDATKFPHGIAAVANYVHSLGLKFGFYLTPGIPVAAVNQNTPIEGTTYHARDIADTSKGEINYNYGGGTRHTVMYYINYNKPGAQAFINSWADQLASWGIDYLKIDGVGSFDIPDVQAWSAALKQSGRPILYDLSNELNINNVSTWRTAANAWRIDGDVECYNCGSNLTSWNHVVGRFTDAPKWVQYAGPGGWNDLDALQVSDGALNGINNVERQTYMTLWSIEAAPLYAGDDLIHMDNYGLSLLTNTEVIAIDQAGHPAHPVSQSTNQQVWFSNNGNGTYTVALFNLGSSTATVTANWSNLGFSGSAAVRDLWSHSNLGSFNGSFGASLAAHGSRLLTVSPGSSTGGGASYEAEASANTLAGGAVAASCAACSGGHKVGYVGKSGTLQFNNINVAQAGTHTLTIYYVDGDAGRSAQMSVNGGATTTLNFPGTNNWNNVLSLAVSIHLNAGNNTIKFSNASNWAPDFDRITLS